MEDKLTMMYAAYIDEKGDANQIKYGKVPFPNCSDTDLIIKMEAVTVDSVDIFVREGRYKTNTPYPFVIGRDLVGIVQFCGRGINNFKIGDKVWTNSLGYSGRQGSFSEYVSISEDRVYHLPDNSNPIETVAILHPAATAYLALFTHGNLKPGQTILIAGAAGHVGSMAVKMATNAGARVIATCKPSDFDYCTSLGAEKAIDYNITDIASTLKSTFPDGIDLYFDTSGKYNLDTAIDVLNKRGKIILIAGIQNKTQLSAGNLYTKDISLVGFAISNAKISELQDAANYINNALLKNQLKAKKIEIMKINDAKEAQLKVENKQTNGARIVLIPNTIN